MQKYANFVDLVRSFPTSVYLQNRRRYKRKRASQSSRLHVTEFIRITGRKNESTCNRHAKERTLPATRLPIECRRRTVRVRILAAGIAPAGRFRPARIDLALASSANIMCWLEWFKVPAFDEFMVNKFVLVNPGHVTVHMDKMLLKKI